MTHASPLWSGMNGYNVQALSLFFFNVVRSLGFFFDYLLCAIFQSVLPTHVLVRSVAIWVLVKLALWSKWLDLKTRELGRKHLISDRLKFVKSLMLYKPWTIIVSHENKQTILYLAVVANGQRHNPGWMQFRHDKSRIERWRENPYKDNITLKTNITNNL